MINENIKMVGKVSMVLTGPDGEIKDQREIDNLVVLAGRVFIASRMANASAAVMSHMAVGTNNTAPVAGDTALLAEVAASRVALTSTTPSSNTVVYVATFNPGVGTGALVEAGIFNAASLGTLLCRTIFSVINKAAADTLTITWTVTINP